MWNRRVWADEAWGQPKVSYAEHPVRGASDRAWAAVQDVSVDHGGADVVVAQELLDRPDVVTIFQQVGSERVAKCVAAYTFGFRRGRRGPHRG
jgi:hypothetical protein